MTHITSWNNFSFFRNGECDYFPEPIDAVYTWVNGSDPEFTKQLRHWANRMHLSQQEPGDIDHPTDLSRFLGNYTC